MHCTQVRTRATLALALVVVLTLGACELADSPDADTSASPAADDGIESAAEQSPAEVATEEPGAGDPDDDDDADDEAGRDAVEEEEGASGDGDVIEVEMTEFAYEPSTIELTAGEPTVVRFVNVGEIEHEAMLGTAHMQQEFAADDDHGDHGDHGDHSDADHHGGVEAVTVAPGETAELEVLIEEPGTWYLGCHLQGHYDAGMEAEVHVTR